MTDNSFSHSFPAIRGVQSGRPCYIAMCPMRIVPKLFRFDEEDVPPELRAQRSINRSRVPEIASYLINNTNNYTLSSLTASVNSNVHFDPFGDVGVGQNMGTISIPMDAQILINDGQHRRAAIEIAIRENPELGHDSISVLFFIDEGLSRSQQMFADLNKHAVRPSDSISTLYDLRDKMSQLSRDIQKNVHVFSRLTELEKSSLSNRSTKLFTLSSIKNANRALLRKGNRDEVTKAEKDLAVTFWNEVASNMPDWQLALNKEISTKELRENYIHAHAVMLQAMGHIGADLLSNEESVWRKALKKLRGIDWARGNSHWEGRAMVHGRISKTRTNVTLTGNYIKESIGLPLNAAEDEIEKQYKK
jgi:DNA sulfur modification protein DndB